MSEMDENTFEIRDGEIDVEEIMAEIRENIRRRKEAGVYPDDGALPAGCMTASASRTDLPPGLARLNAVSDVRNGSYSISSHRPVAGTFLVKGREVVHGEVRRYVDPVFWKQSEFNGNAVQVFADMHTRLADLESMVRPDGAAEEIRAWVREIVAGTRRDFTAALRQEDGELRSWISSLVEEKVRERLAETEAEVGDLTGLARLLERRVSPAVREGASVSACSEDAGDSGEAGLNYFVFEERFRGSRKEIRGRQEVFLPCFENCRNVLDIGCGRGEFLELARERGIGARGVDIDDLMVGFCRSKGLAVEKADAVRYLEGLDDLSLDGIFIDQVVEHLEPACLVGLLALCHRKLQYGYYLIAGTVNPLSFVSLANFYLDVSHVRPVHPETLKFLFGAAGFREVEVRFFSPVSEEGRLRKLAAAEGADEWVPAFVESYNHNVELLNRTLYGAQDYAVIGKK